MKSLLLAGALLVPCNGQDFGLEDLQRAFADELDAFDVISFTPGETPAKLSVKLGETPVKIEDEVFDGFRFKFDGDPEKLDFIWYFNAPENWSNWYILPVSGEAGQAFRGWLDGDKVYRDLDKPGEKDRLRVLQTLTGDYFTKGAEYVVWFRQVKKGGSADLRGLAMLADRNKTWDHDDIEEALALKPAPLEDQVAALNSRGGLILLDDEFFTRRDAGNRIDSAFFSIRSTKRMAGGFFITTQIAIPPCDTDPPIADIVAKHGAPDFIRSGAEVARVRKHSGGSPPEDDEAGLTRYYYDYFAFEVDPDAEIPAVERVVTHGNDFSVLQPPAKGSSYATLGMENLTVFHRDGKEVGRAYSFLEDEKEPLFITEPPPGDYRSGEQVLTAKGGGEWKWEFHYPDGKLARRFLLKGNRFDGSAEGFHRDGKPAFTATYRQGVLHGELVKFDGNGEEVSRQRFENGEPASE
ncbi:toxin-antitoxin system YwqK family antitoxin [Luteolibacter marinus]|uniref:toxin-antitoxin system YwqK family antitoxin n=1 Tax=Luteolibacter marinus TaxID=2776705 RepID=UPI001866DD1B|nr:hypothetical protein [Luteolibacter marinus]